MDSLCISYVSASATNFFFSKGSGKKKRKREYQRHRSSTPTTPVSGEAGGTPEVSDDDENNVHVDIADIVEVREGFATDTFNEAAKSAESLKISTFLKVKSRFSRFQLQQNYHFLPPLKGRKQLLAYLLYEVRSPQHSGSGV